MQSSPWHKNTCSMRRAFVIHVVMSMRVLGIQKGDCINMRVQLSKKGNTKIIPYFNGQIVKLYNTSIVIFDEKQITLNSGGYQTSTTKNRMNQTSTEYSLGFYIWQKKGRWFVTFQGEELDFFDGMTLNREI